MLLGDGHLLSINDSIAATVSRPISFLPIWHGCITAKIRIVIRYFTFFAPVNENRSCLLTGLSSNAAETSARYIDNLMNKVNLSSGFGSFE